jgi:hypothetical protein
MPQPQPLHQTLCRAGATQVPPPWDYFVFPLSISSTDLGSISQFWAFLKEKQRVRKFPHITEWFTSLIYVHLKRTEVTDRHILKIQNTCHGANETKEGPLPKVPRLHIMVHYQIVCTLITKCLKPQHVQFKKYRLYSYITSSKKKIWKIICRTEISA